MKNYLIIDLPIEPIERRYSCQWARWFPEAYARNGLPYITITGDKPSTTPSPDKFLDPRGTFVWKFSQLYRALGACTDPSCRYVIFAHDGWFPGLEMFPYLRDLDGMDIKVCSFWHAGAYDPTDLLGLRGCSSWAAGSESSWFTLSDAIVTGSHYHKNKICTAYQISPDKIHVVGYPVQHNESPIRKEPLVIWPHRISEDKCPEIFDRLSRESCFAGVEFLKSLSICRNKEEYHNLLARAKVAVSTATHENFGIAMVEAACAGAYPLCPNRLAYRETIEPICLYDTYDELVAKTAACLMQLQPYNYPYSEKYTPNNVTDSVCNILKNLGEGE